MHAAVDTATGLPVAWQIETASKNETQVVPDLLDKLAHRGMVPEHAVMDRGYDVNPVYELCAQRGIRPVISLRETPFVKAGKHLPRECEHGTWAFAGSDAKRGASKWRCPTGDCTPASEWVKADRLHPLIPRTTQRFRDLYHQRGTVEREFGRLKHEWAMLPLRVRRIERVALHVDLTVLAQLVCALVDARAVPLAA